MTAAHCRRAFRVCTDVVRAACRKRGAVVLRAGPGAGSGVMSVVAAGRAPACALSSPDAMSSTSGAVSGTSRGATSACAGGGSAGPDASCCRLCAEVGAGWRKIARLGDPPPAGASAVRVAPQCGHGAGDASCWGSGSTGRWHCGQEIGMGLFNHARTGACCDRGRGAPAAQRRMPSMRIQSPSPVADRASNQGA